MQSEKNEAKVEKKSDISTSRETDRSKKDRSPSSKAKSDSKKGSSNSKSSSSKSSKSSSKSGSKGKDDKSDSVSKSDTRKRARENDSLPGSPDKGGRIEPLPQPDPSLGRIPKVKRSDDGEKKRGNKRPGSGQGQKVSPVPEKKPKPLFIE